MSRSSDPLPITPEVVQSLQKVLLQKQMLACRVASGSMSPFLSVGEMVQVGPLSDSSDLKRFDLIVFFDGVKLICHFVWTTNHWHQTPRVTTRSLERCRVNDPLVGRDAILGKVTSHKLPWRYRFEVLLKNFLSGSF